MIFLGRVRSLTRDFSPLWAKDLNSDEITLDDRLELEMLAATQRRLHAAAETSH